LKLQQTPQTTVILKKLASTQPVTALSAQPYCLSPDTAANSGLSAQP